MKRFHAVSSFDKRHHSLAEITVIAIERLQSHTPERTPHRLRIPEQLARPRHHAHRLISRLDQALIKPVLLKVSVGLGTNEKDRLLDQVIAQIGFSC